MSNETTFDWKNELMRYEPSPNSKVITYVNTTCSNNVVADDKQKKNSQSLYQKKTNTFLNTQKSEYTISIEGKEIILKKGNDLYIEICDQRDYITASNPHVSLKNLIIACDVLEIHDDLILPECNVSIFARVLDTKNGVTIHTKPLKWDRERAEDANMNSAEEDTARNGAHGKNAGHVNIFVQTVQGKFLYLNTNGGHGQDAGQGKDGKAGNSVSNYYSSQVFKHTEAGIFFDSVTECKAEFSPYATLIKYEWYYFSKSNPNWKRIGNDDLPTNGTNAKKPGNPGESGNAGNICINMNKPEYFRYEMKPGTAGRMANDAHGGAAGYPSHSGQYEVQMEVKNTKKHETVSASINRIKETKTVAGKSYPGTFASRHIGTSGTFTEEKSRNAWLHPAQLKIVLKYARAEYLRNQSKETISQLREVLQTYLTALNQELPGIDVWNERTLQTWSKSQDSIAAFITKMEGQKDYFNNPAGYMPLLTLSSAIALYQGNVKNSIKSLVLAKWLTYSQEQAKETKDIINTTYGNITEESKRLAEEMKKVLQKIKSVEDQHTNIESELDKLAKKLFPIEERLIKKANDDLQQKAKVKFGLKMGAALLQVIPYGQPALGVVGKMTSSVADNYGEDMETMGKGVKDVLAKEKLGDVLKKTKEGLSKAKKNADKQKSAALVVADKDKSSANDIFAEFEEQGLMYDGERFAAFKRKGKINISGGEKVEEQKKEKEEKTSKWSQISGNIGPAVSDVVGAFKSLSVPESEVFAAADKLKTDDKEWNDVLKEITKFNKDKAKFFKEFVETLEEYTALSSQIQHNTIMALKLRDSVGKQAGLADEDVLDFANELEERTKNQLIYQLYLMTKAYETTTFETLEVNWQTENVFDKISGQINTKGAFSLANLDAIVSAVEPVFNTNINNIKDQILAFLEKNLPKYRTMFITLNKETPQLHDLNKDKSITIDPHKFNCILPNFHFMKLKDIKLSKLEFENVTNNDVLNSVLSIRLNPEGIIRVGDKFRIVRSVPRIHTWSPTPTDWRKDEVSKTVTDLFDTLIEKKNVERLAMPPAWSEFELSFSPSEDAIQKNAVISQLQLEFTYEVVDADPSQKVIDIKSIGATGANIKISKLKPEDIYFTGAFYDVTTLKNTIQLEAEQTANEIPFKEWQLIYDTGIVQNKDLTAHVDLSKPGLKNIRCVYEPVLLKSGSNARVKKLRFPPLALFTSPDGKGEVFSFVEHENIIETRKGDGMPEGWEMVSTRDITGFVKRLVED